MNSNRKPTRTILTVIAVYLTLYTTPTKAFFINGSGHYGLQGETRTRPGFSEKRGMHQAILQSFRLDTEVRANEDTSFFLDMQLFDDPRSAYLGDTPRPAECSPLVAGDTGENQSGSNTGSLNGAECDNRHQNSIEPGYKPYVPSIRKAYIQHAFDYCLLTAGRRDRDWGLGIMLDKGEKPFSTSASTFDGVTCNVNVQKAQTLGFSFGFDKLSETGVSTTLQDTLVTDRFGAAARGDDLEQLFFTIEYDDRLANLGTGLTRQIGFYFANVFGGKDGDEKLKTDIKIADFYAAVFWNRLSFRNEVIFRLGKSAEPNWARLGGTTTRDDTPIENDVQSVGLAGRLDYVLSTEGIQKGPPVYQEGTLESHSIFLEYAYAPGDKNGYERELNPDNGFSDERTDKKATAMSFHRNYKPALLLFNGHPDIDDMRVDGIYDPSRVMNASVFAIGYRYSSMEAGSFELKLLTANLNVGMSQDPQDAVRQRFICNDSNAATCSDRPVGYAGKQLGYELDLKYDKNIGKNVALGAAAAVALPGNAFDDLDSSGRATNYLLQSTVTFKF